MTKTRNHVTDSARNGEELDRAQAMIELRKQMGQSGTLLADLQAYFRRYVVFANADYPLVCALWACMTYLWTDLDSVPYLVITSDTKRSGKTRLMELLMFLARNPRTLAAPTPAGIFRSIGKKKIGPTLFIDEAETMSGEAAGALRSVVNAGYRRGQSVTRIEQGKAKAFNTYCPKCFVLIGDPFDTLRDRSILLTMRRGEAPARFVYGLAKDEGAALALRIKQTMEKHRAALLTTFQRHEGLAWLPDRDEEIWTPLFTICEVLAPELVPALKAISADLATDKTADTRRYTTLHDAEGAAEDDEYAARLVRDLASVLGDKPALSTVNAIAALRAIPTAPWRKFRGEEGLTAIIMSDLLSRFRGLAPTVIRFPGEGDGPRTATGHKHGSYTGRGYRAAAVRAALDQLTPGTAT